MMNAKNPKVDETENADTPKSFTVGPKSARIIDGLHEEMRKKWGRRVTTNEVFELILRRAGMWKG